MTAIDRVAALERIAEVRRRVVAVIELLGLDEVEALAVVVDDLARGRTAVEVSPEVQP